MFEVFSKISYESKPFSLLPVFVLLCGYGLGIGSVTWVLWADILPDFAIGIPIAVKLLCKSSIHFFGHGII